MNENMMEARQDWYNDMVANDDSIINVDDVYDYVMESNLLHDISLADLMALQNKVKRVIEDHIDEIKQKGIKDKEIKPVKMNVVRGAYWDSGRY